MSTTLVQKHSIRKVEAPDWKYRTSANDDKASTSATYTDNFEGWTSRLPQLGSPDPYLIGFGLIEIDATRVEGDLIQVTLKYESHTAQYPGRDPNAAKTKRYSAEITNGEEHILTHNRYGENLTETELKALLAISNGTEDKQTGEQYADDITTALGLEVLAKIRKGNNARKTAGLIWIEESTTDTLADINFAQINKTQQPPGGVGGTAANWLYLGSPARETDQGGTYKLTKRWEFSPDGWDPDLYTT